MSRSESGFSLAEVMVALMLVGIGLLAVAPLFVQGERTTAVSGDLGTVGAQAVQRLELLRATTFGSLPAGGSLASNVVGYSDTSTAGLAVRWTVTDNATPASLKTLTVRAIATRRVLGLQKQYEIATLRSR